jgi:hypothetical protein
MATFYKGVEYLSKPREQVVYHKKQTFSNIDEGINSIQYRSESLDFETLPGNHTYTISGSHYQFINNFYNNDGAFDGYVNIHRNKFYESGSVIYIPQQYFGEKIKKETFKLTDNSTSKEIVVKDDGNGNLYSTNAHNSRSAATSVSSSDNYVGNIHYESGVVVLAETASWSGSGLLSTDINYTDVGTSTFKLNFESTQTIYQNEITIKIKAHEFNTTANQTIFRSKAGGHSSEISANISKSLDEWSPYTTGVAFYNKIPSALYTKMLDLGDREIISKSYGDEYNPTDEFVGDDVIFYAPEVQPVMVAKFPRPLKIDKNGEITIIIRYDT